MDAVFFRAPKTTDGPELNELVKRCTPLDTNSVYCNLLQASHFSTTGVAAEYDGRLMGFVSGYLVPERNEPTWFVWQVAVDSQLRGQGIAKRMLQHKLAQLPEVRYLETTITRDNQASWRLFERLAKDLNAPLHSELWFERQVHFHDRHDSEYLVRIGPLS